MYLCHHRILTYLENNPLTKYTGIDNQTHKTTKRNGKSTQKPARCKLSVAKCDELKLVEVDFYLNNI